MVRLERITEDNYKECLNLKVRADQESFVSSNAHSLAKAYVYYHIVTPFAVYEDDIMVGFMLIRFNERFCNYFIWQFMIDERYQGRGYGKEAMILAINWMKTDERCKEIVLTYKEGNECAEKLYTQLGFVRLNDIEDGEIDMVLRY
ncbi:MAG: GNAT family N-acetyltransferase [Bacillota bacterium]